MVGVETCDAYLVVRVLLVEAHCLDTGSGHDAECEEAAAAPR